MNVDVSPDGTQVVFDLLGDIYIVPIAGSTAPARRVTTGPAFDMQPRFSPDGKRIAIASDRDGLWNIWTIDLEGKDAKQISRERRWFVNSPAWSPDGTSIYARRHFVKERSLGAGEIWMYHSAGPSDGLQVTERTGWQKDAGEPDISPDGNTLYYSKDVTPGQTLRVQQGPERDDLRDHAPRSDDGPRAARRQCAGRFGDAAGLTRREVDRLRAPGAPPELPLRPRSRVRSRSAALREHRQRSAGSLGHSRSLSAVRMDARRQVDRDLGRGEDLARRCCEREGTADPVPGARGADAQRRRACAPRRSSAGVPGQDAARRPRLARRHARRLQRARASLHANAAVRRAEAADAGLACRKRLLRVLSRILPRRSMDRVYDMERRGPRTCARGEAGRLRRSRRTHASGSLCRALVLARRPVHRLSSRGW